MVEICSKVSVVKPRNLAFFLTEIKLSFVMWGFRFQFIFCALFKSVLGVSLAAPHCCLWIQRYCGIFHRFSFGESHPTVLDLQLTDVCTPLGRDSKH